MEETSRDGSTHYRSQPVNPVVSSKICRRYARPKRARWVHGRAGVVDACDLDNEQGKANANGCDERVFGFFSREHENGEHQVGGQEL